MNRVESVEIEMLGAGNEVGRSAILVRGVENILLDCGVKIQPEPPKYPDLPKGIDACVISHAHLDHCGAAPMLFANGTKNMYMTDATLELSTLLINDSMKVARKEGYFTPFGKNDLKAMIKGTRAMNYNHKFRIGGFSCSLYDAGHIPGSAGVLMHSIKNGRKIFYTGDIQTADSQLLRGCRLPAGADTLIIESTYGVRDHPPREKEEKRLLEEVEEALAQNEVVLMPVFAIGRAQEVMLILEKYAGRIALDGMAKSASEIVSNHGRYLKNKGRFRNMLKRVKFIRTDAERAKALGRYPIIITSAGMLGGGPAIHYLRAMQKWKASKVIFTGFLVEESPGRNLIETKIFKNAEEQFHVHCELHQFGLSAHAGRSGLFDIIRKLKPKQVICVHGDQCGEFAKDISERFGIDAFAPKNGESVRI